MTKVQHTPGPWVAAEIGTAGWIDIYPTSGPHLPLCSARHYDKQIKANACLIAAAPDAYKLAAYILANAEQETLSEGIEVTFPPHAAALILNMAEAFLAKAEGK